ncbi:MAG: serine/threonine protein kinase [Archangium sp.]|nr:serine/threonine protein kinase [Archangium sp.]
MGGQTIGRYVVLEQFAAGGMATVHFGCVTGSQGFRRIVAIKRMRPGLMDEPAARAALIDEGRIASRVRHVNVVQTLDVVAQGNELLLVLEYVLGESLDKLLKLSVERRAPIPTGVVASILAGALRGLHAAHTARGEDGAALDLVHRDVSPHNILIDASGVARVADFGIAKARGRLQHTQTGQLKGKLAYVAPEQIHGDCSPRSDLFSVGVVLWECLALKRLFSGQNEAEVLSAVLLAVVPPIEGADPRLLSIARRALSRRPEDRFTSALEMAEAVEAVGVASSSEVSAWLRGLVPESLDVREARVLALEREQLEPTESGALAPPRRGLLVPVLGASLLVGAALAAAFAIGRSGSTPSPVVVVPAPPPAVVDAGTVVAVAPDAGAEPPVVLEARVDPPVVDAGAAVPIGKRKVGKKSADCAVPWTIDANGRKKYKLQCL